MQGNAVWAMGTFNGRGQFSGTHRLETIWPTRTIFSTINWIHEKLWQKTKLMLIVPMGFASPIWWSCFFLNIIYKLNGSADFDFYSKNDMVQHKEVPFRGYSDSNFHWGVNFSPHNFHWLGWELENAWTFCDINDGSMDKPLLHLKSRGLQQWKIVLTKNPA